MPSSALKKNANLQSAGCSKTCAPQRHPLGARLPDPCHRVRSPGICVRGRLLWRCGPCVFFNETATSEIYTLSLHDALPIYADAKALAEPERRRSYRAEVRQWM